MGVPKFFAWLLRKYKNKEIVFQKQTKKLDWLLIDTNCLIHPTCFKVLAEEQTSNMETLEKKMINAVIEYIEKIIKYVDPQKGVYIAIDGPVCAAKMKQQRQRRFRSVHDKAFFDKIKEKYGREIGTYWSNSAISPGTPFMNKIHNKILTWSNLEQNKGLKIIYSSANTPGEGEHKLLDFIKENKINKINNSYVTYGLDADLIFLMLVTNLDDVFLLREAQEFDNKLSKDVLNYVSIKLLKESIAESFSIEFINKNKDFLSNYFIFLCYFLGNDFLPHLYALDIGKKGIEHMIKKYSETYNETLEYLLDCSTKIPSINQNFLSKFIQKVSAEEESILTENMNQRRYAKCQSDDAYDREMFKIENILFKVEDPIGLGVDSNYRFKYYHHYFGVEKDDIEDFVKEMVKQYLTGIRWVTNYYFDTNINWDWFYPYDYPPFLSDINKYLINMNDVTFKKTNPITPFEQLLVILPPQSSFLLPPTLAKLTTNPKSSLAHLYPLEFQVDFLYKHRYYEGIPRLPELEINLVKHTFAKYADGLSKDEKELNKLKDNYYFN
jgi:5'-3' exonuclease